MSLPLVSFLILAGLAILSALSVILQKSVVHSAISLVAALFFVAVLFLTLEAAMVAVLQILVYAGAIMVLFLFVIMLLNPQSAEKRAPFWRALGAVAALVLALELAAFFLPVEKAREGLKEGFGSPEMLARSLFTDFVLPFEIASVLLLVAVVGAVVLAKREA